MSAITLKTKDNIMKMAKAGEITALALHEGGRNVAPGITTGEINKIIHAFIKSKGAIPSFLGYGGFPASACISVNNEVIHGIPGKRVLQDGDIVSIDVGAIYDGWHGDTAYTFSCGNVSDENKRLLDATQLSLAKAIEVAQVGNRLGDIGHAVSSVVEPLGFSVVRDFVGHGIGRNMHEAPEVPNYGLLHDGLRLTAGMVIAIEPMINAGQCSVKVLADDWTVTTVDNSPSAHFEHTIAITDNGPVILTALR